jgi:hypothetical protein
MAAKLFLRSGLPGEAETALVPDHKIIEHWGSRDDLGLLGQLGLLPIGEEPEAG